MTTTWKPMPPPSIDQLAEDAPNYIRALCAEGGVTQKAAAETVGMGLPTFAKYIGGNRKTETNLYLLQHAMECLVGAQVTRKVRRQFGMRMPRVPRD